MKTKKPQNVSEQNKWIHEFENLYILTYKSLYRHAKLIFNQEEKTKEREMSAGLAAETF